MKGIGPGRSSMLASYGIETAADIDARKVKAIPGFGPALTAELMAWRRSHERNFRYNADEPLNPLDVAALDREIEASRRKLIAALQRGPESLRSIHREILVSRPALLPMLHDAWQDLKEAETRIRSL